MSQAVKRLNAAGLAHSDLSYKNVLLDPPGSGISIIDLDGLVVTGKFNPEVIGTSDFIAPEVMSTQHLDLTDPKRVLPRSARTATRSRSLSTCTSSTAIRCEAAGCLTLIRTRTRS